MRDKPGKKKTLSPNRILLLAGLVAISAIPQIGLMINERGDPVMWLFAFTLGLQTIAFCLLVGSYLLKRRSANTSDR